MYQYSRNIYISLVYIKTEGHTETAVLLKVRFQDNIYTAKVIGKHGTEIRDIMVDINTLVKQLYPVGAAVTWFYHPSMVYTGTIVGYRNDIVGAINYVISDGKLTGNVPRVHVHLT